MRDLKPTGHSQVNAVLAPLRSRIEAILGDRLVGIYLYGSLATGDYDEERSDIDFVVVTKGALSDQVIGELRDMHADLIANGPIGSEKLEGTYIPQSDLRRYTPRAGPFPCINEGQFYVAHHGSDWIIQRQTLREQSLIVMGPQLKPLIDPVHPRDLRQAVRGFLNSWWRPMLQDPDPRLSGGEYQSYAVLTMCRSLYTLKFGDVVSKSQAATWAQETLGAPWAGLIAWAAAWRPGEPARPRDRILDFIRYVVARSERHT